MPTQALTTDFLNSLHTQPASVGLVNYFDTETKGFMLEVRASGGATFYFRYRDGGGRIRMNRIGRRDEIALADARAKAHQMKKMVIEGGDPKVENHRFKDIPTFAEFFHERFLPFVNPDGHFKFPRLWSPKFPQAGRFNYGVLAASRVSLAAASFSR